MSGLGIRWWRAALARLWRPRTPAESIEDLIDRGKVVVHRLDPGGVVILSGVSIRSKADQDRLASAMQGLGEVDWVLTPYSLGVDAISPALRALLVHQLTAQLPVGPAQPWAISGPEGRPMPIRCPRCSQDVQMAILVSLTDTGGHLSARAIVDPADVDLHDLSCNGPDGY